MSGEQLERALLSLEGLSVGDAFGERFFTHPDVVEGMIAQRALAPPPWRYTDDTEMALSIVEELRDTGSIEPNSLGRRFAERYAGDRMRGYGRAMHELLPQISLGVPAVMAAEGLFDGSGSYGNGAAMRAAPIGGYGGPQALDDVVELARLSALPTHAHVEGQAGAIAVAVAAALASDAGFDLRDVLAQTASRLPECEVREGVLRAQDLEADATVEQAASLLGNGRQITAQDTVPFCLWIVSRHKKGGFEETLWRTVSALGDRDTTCAIVGGVVVLRDGLEGIPASWLEHREPLPAGLV